MSGYTKLFSSILASTIWREDDKTRIVWITLLAMTDRFGVAEGSIPGLADFARVSVEDCERALKRLSSPDKHSRSKASDGRRIEDVPGGWHVINHGAYRDKMNADERREYLRIKKREERQRRQQMSTNVNTRRGLSRVSTHTDSSTRSRSKKEQKKRAVASPQDNYRVITKLAHEVVKATPEAGFTDLKADLKEACAKHHIDYQAEVVGKALESALAQRASLNGC